MMRCRILAGMLMIGLSSYSQRLDSLFFNLYTDSLKLGTYNYINVDGRFEDGTWLPLGPKEIRLSSSDGLFEGNNLYLDSCFTGKKVRVRAELIKNPGVYRETEIYIKQYEDDSPLPTVDEILNRPSGKKRKKRK